MITPEIMEKLKEIAKKHNLINESTFSYFPELEVIRPLFNETFKVLKKHCEKYGLWDEEEIEIFVDYKGFKFTIGEFDGPYDQVYIHLKEAEEVEYKTFEEVFDIQ